ncbi:MAG: glutamine--fructose-6-phosphate transaminase (isomerizing) [Eubacteriales bacterium]
MCGIVGYIGAESAIDTLLSGLEKLEYRGYDSAGISVFGNGKIENCKTKGRLSALAEKIKLEGFPDSYGGIGHTRWATHGAPSNQNSHPHASQSEHFSVVHNGIIENYLEIKEFLEKEGYSFRSETDSEVVAHLLEHYHRGNPQETLREILPKLRGAYALGVICQERPDEILAVRKDSPLLVGLGKTGNYIASDIPALLEYTREYYLLEDNEIAILTKNGVSLQTMEGKPIEKEIFHVTWDIQSAEKGGYDFFMMKEMVEQPEGLRKTISPRITDQGDIDLEFSKITTQDLKNCGHLHIVACGSAAHAGLVARYVFENLAKLPVNVDIASEFRYRNPILQKNDLCIIISQSGETADTLAALREAKKQGVRVISIVNVVGSSIARESDEVIYTWAGPEIAVATTKGYTTQLSVLYLLALEFAKVRGTISQEDFSQYLCELQRLPQKTETALAQEGRMKGLAALYAQSHSVFVIGRGTDYGAAMEGSLKLKEISYIGSEAYAAGELKHGTISLIEEGTLVIAIATQIDLLEKVASNIKEVKARGATVIAITLEGSTSFEAICDQVVYLPQTLPPFTPSLNIIPMQLFAYYVAVERGCDVDKPRNLAKSVTVE